MATRLNKVMIEEIIEKAIKATDIPKRIDQIKRKTSEVTRAALLKQLPPELVALTKVHPKEWFRWQDSMHMGVKDNDRNPLAVMSEAEGRYEKAVDVVFEPIPQANYSEASLDLSFLVGELAEAQAIAKLRDEIKTNLRAYLRSKNTVEAAVKDMPELGPFMPVATQGGPLVAPSNVASLLAQAGFKSPG